MLMNALIFIGLLLYLFGAGYFFTYKISIILENIHKKDEMKKVTSPKVLVWGQSDLSYQLDEYLSKHKIDYLHLSEISTEKTNLLKDFHFVFALDDSDYNNLVICDISRKLYQAKYTFAVCNDQINRIIYSDYDIHLLDKKRLTPEYFIELMREKENDSRFEE